jgi:hypothetical protein
MPGILVTTRTDPGLTQRPPCQATGTHPRALASLSRMNAALSTWLSARLLYPAPGGARCATSRERCLPSPQMLPGVAEPRGGHPDRPPKLVPRLLADDDQHEGFAGRTASLLDPREGARRHGHRRDRRGRVRRHLGDTLEAQIRLVNPTLTRPGAAATLVGCWTLLAGACLTNPATGLTNSPISRPVRSRENPRLQGKAAPPE